LHATGQYAQSRTECRFTHSGAIIVHIHRIAAHLVVPKKHHISVQLGSFRATINSSDLVLLQRSLYAQFHCIVTKAGPAYLVSFQPFLREQVRSRRHQVEGFLYTIGGFQCEWAEKDEIRR
jgi:hypothetical protein